MARRRYSSRMCYAGRAGPRVLKIAALAQDSGGIVDVELKQ